MEDQPPDALRDEVHAAARLSGGGAGSGHPGHHPGHLEGKGGLEAVSRFPTGGLLPWPAPAALAVEPTPSRCGAPELVAAPAQCPPPTRLCPFRLRHPRARGTDRGSQAGQASRPLGVRGDFAFCPAPR